MDAFGWKKCLDGFNATRASSQAKGGIASFLLYIFAPDLSAANRIGCQRYAMSIVAFLHKD